MPVVIDYQPVGAIAAAANNVYQAKVRQQQPQGGMNLGTGPGGLMAPGIGMLDSYNQQFQGGGGGSRPQTPNNSVEGAPPSQTVPYDAGDGTIQITRQQKQALDNLPNMGLDDTQTEDQRRKILGLPPQSTNVPYVSPAAQAQADSAPQQFATVNGEQVPIPKAQPTPQMLPAKQVATLQQADARQAQQQSQFDAREQDVATRQKDLDAVRQQRLALAADGQAGIAERNIINNEFQTAVKDNETQRTVAQSAVDNANTAVRVYQTQVNAAAAAVKTAGSQGTPQEVQAAKDDLQQKQAKLDDAIAAVQTAKDSQKVVQAKVQADYDKRLLDASQKLHDMVVRKAAQLAPGGAVAQQTQASSGEADQSQGESSPPSQTGEFSTRGLQNSDSAAISAGMKAGSPAPNGPIIYGPRGPMTLSADGKAWVPVAQGASQ